jgi:hypothetical protein
MSAIELAPDGISHAFANELLTSTAPMNRVPWGRVLHSAYQELLVIRLAPTCCPKAIPASGSRSRMSR